jgi:UDPglucose--hexose-1-phosphate uridylyltransferase
VLRTRARTLPSVPVLRHDELTGDVVLVAPGRAARPHTTAPVVEGDASTCPFCPGHESQTPPEVARVGGGDPDTPGWRIRVFPNLYPAVGGPDAGPDATGAHEVVVVSPDHHRALAGLDDGAVIEVVEVLRARARAHAAAGHAHVQVVVNQGRAAGASIAHPHAQVLALDFVPPAVVAALARFATADRVVEDHEAAAAADGAVLTRGDAAAWCSPSSSAGFEVRLAALGAGRRFAGASEEEVRDVALVLRDTTRLLAAALADPPYNVVVYDAPTRGDEPYHWWVRIVPRLEVPAGFELGTGVSIEPVDPRHAAAFLRAE